MTTTLEDALEKLKFGRFHYKLLVLCGACWAADGCEAVLLSFLIPYLTIHWNVPSGVAGILGATVFIGIFIGAQFWGWLSDKYGRRIGYFACSAFTAVFGLASAFPKDGDFASIAVLRLFVGIGLGGSTVAFSLFAEFLGTSQRGKALVYNQNFWTIGCVLEVLFAWFALEYLNSWKWLVAISSIPMWIIMLTFPWIPESPRYLLTIKGDAAAAEQILNKAALENGVLFDPPLKLEQNIVINTSDVKSTFKMLLHPSHRKTSFAVWGLWFADSFTYYGIAFLVPRIFISAQDSATNSYLSIFLATIAEFPSIPITLFGMDRFGRKKLLFYSFLMCSIFLPLTVFQSNYSLKTLCLVIVRMHIATAYVVSYIYTTEIYPTVVRTTAMGVASSIARIGGVLTSFVANDLSITSATIVIFAISAFGILISCLLPKETAHTALEDVFEMNDEVPKLSNSDTMEDETSTPLN